MTHGNFILLCDKILFEMVVVFARQHQSGIRLLLINDIVMLLDFVPLLRALFEKCQFERKIETYAAQSSENFMTSANFYLWKRNAVFLRNMPILKWVLRSSSILREWHEKLYS